MTEEQIAKMKRLADGIGLVFPDDRPLYERLLEERKRLIHGAKQVLIPGAEGSGFDDLDEALAYAEDAAEPQ